jgi:hypothetical protein
VFDGRLETGEGDLQVVFAGGEIVQYEGAVVVGEDRTFHGGDGFFSGEEMIYAKRNNHEIRNLISFNPIY